MTLKISSWQPPEARMDKFYSYTLTNLQNGGSRLINQVTVFGICVVLSAVEMSQDGEKLVTTSEKGIQVRIFDTRTGVMIQEVRRGN